MNTELQQLKEQVNILLDRMRAIQNTCEHVYIRLEDTEVEQCLECRHVRNVPEYALKVYSQDHSWAGSILTIARSEEKAREYLSKCYNYDANQPLEEHVLEEGFIHENLGDS